MFQEILQTMQSELIVSAGYMLMLLAMALRDVLWLRSVLLLSQIILAFYQLLYGTPTVAFWNSVFALVNFYHVVWIIMERRPAPLPDRLTDIHKTVFRSMTSREFLRFVELGTTKSIEDKKIIKDGETVEAVTMIIEGEVGIYKNGSRIAGLKRGGFVGEMGFLSHQPATADVVAEGEVHCIAWTCRQLSRLETEDRYLYQQFQTSLGRDLVQKVIASSHVVTENDQSQVEAPKAPPTSLTA